MAEEYLISFSFSPLAANSDDESRLFVSAQIRASALGSEAEVIWR